MSRLRESLSLGLVGLGIAIVVLFGVVGALTLATATTGAVKCRLVEPQT